MDICSKFRLLARRWRVYSGMMRAGSKRVVPLVSDLFITTRCNGMCNYCYRDDTITAEQELTTQQWFDVIDELHDMGCRMFNLMGGEPLLRSDFVEILDHILAKNVLCDVNTNGFLVPKYIEPLKRASQIFTSLDGDQPAHDANRGEGTFRKAMDGILAARQAGIPVRVNCTITRHSAAAVDFLVDLAEQHNLFLTFTPLIRVRESRLARAADLEMTDAEARQAFKRIKQAKKHTRRIMNSDASLDFFINYPVKFGRIVWQSESDTPHGRYYDKPCPYGRLQFFIIPNGDVLPCHNLWNEPTFKPKNVIRDGVPEAILATNAMLKCKFCWLANLVEWNEFTSPAWLLKGAHMTLCQLITRK